MVGDQWINMWVSLAGATPNLAEAGALSDISCNVDGCASLKRSIRQDLQ